MPIIPLKKDKFTKHINNLTDKDLPPFPAI